MSVMSAMSVMGIDFFSVSTIFLFNF
jgi:hypothetical protein